MKFRGLTREDIIQLFTPEKPMTETPHDPFAALAASGVTVPRPIEDDADLPRAAAPEAEQVVAAPSLETFVDDVIMTPKLAVNPKEAQGALKASIYSVFPRWVSLLVGRVMATGAAKYGKFNYRDTPIAASTYEDAMERHAQLWFDGEDNDPESGVSHLAHVIACATLLLDAQATGKLVDDRQKTGLVNKALGLVADAHARLGLPASKREA